MSILVVGDIAVDSLGIVSHFPEVSTNAEVNNFTKAFGGSAANTAVVARMLGDKVGFASVIGHDFPEGYMDRLKKMELDLTYLAKSELNTTSVFIFSKDNDQVSFFYPGSSQELDGMRIPRDYLSKFDIVHMCRNFPSLQYRIVRECRDLRTKVSYNPGYGIDEMDKLHLRRIIKGTDILFLNEAELEYMLELFGLEAPQDVRGWADLDILVLTLGKDGSRVMTREGEDAIVPAIELQVVDPTGAGDSFTAGFLTSLVRTRDPVEAAKIGSATASYVITSTETQPTITLDNVMEKRRRQYI